MEFFRGAAHAREAVHALTLAADRDGALVALRDRYAIDLGASIRPWAAPLTSIMLAGPYRLRDAEIHRRVVLTNKVPMGAYRGYGQAESNYVREGARRPAAVPPRPGFRRRPPPQPPAA